MTSNLISASIISLLSSTVNAASLKHCDGTCQNVQNQLTSERMHGIMEQKRIHWEMEKLNGQMGTTPSTGSATCSGGSAGDYGCSKIDLGAFVSHADLGSTDLRGNDIWGWTDDQGNEYAIACCSDGTSFVDVTNPDEPVVLGFLPGTALPSNWRDVKVYKHYAYIGSEARDHGLQVFDMSQLTTTSNAYRERVSSVRMTKRDIAKDGHIKLDNTFNSTTVYAEFGSSHNIVINEESGFLYAVGTKTCAGGLHIVDLNPDPADPQFVGCYSDDGYTHDAECVIYSGPDTRYTGHEICFNYNEDTLTLVDVTDKDKMVEISRTGYVGAYYTHQGWLNPAQSHLVMDDEKDEQQFAELNGHTRTMIWDVSDLTAPFISGNFYSEETSIDHNQYMHNGYVWQANYCAGLRVLDASQLESGSLTEVAYFDVAPECDTAVFTGSWSVYPYFKSGTVIVQSIEKGLFVVKPKL